MNFFYEFKAIFFKIAKLNITQKLYQKSKKCLIMNFFYKFKTMLLKIAKLNITQKLYQKSKKCLMRSKKVFKKLIYKK